MGEMNNQSTEVFELKENVFDIVVDIDEAKCLARDKNGKELASADKGGKMNHYSEIIKRLCEDLSRAKDGDSMKFVEMEIAAVTMLQHGYVFDTDRACYVRDYWKGDTHHE